MNDKDEVLSLDMGGKQPRDYQIDTVHQCREKIRQGKRRIVICKPTGSGKTTTACMLMKLAAEKKRRTVFLASRRELVLQAAEHLADCNVFHGVVLAQHDGKYEPQAPVQVASRQTLSARTVQRKRMPLPKADMLVIDECHGATSQQHLVLIKKFMQANPRLVVIGLSATPARSDGKGLGDIFDDIVQPVTYEELRQNGFLVPCKVYGLHCPDMRRVKSAEWDRSAAHKVDRPKLVGDVYENWRKYADGRQTIAFAKTIDHSLHILDTFREKGIKIAHIDESTPVDERKQVLEDLSSGELQIVTNVGICTEGWDEPCVSAVILAAPSRSLIKYRQASGRALRPFAGKADCVILDHAGAVFQHGMYPDDDIDWELSKSSNTAKELIEKRRRGETKEPTLCNDCKQVYFGNRCPCGSTRGTSGRKIAVQHGLLKEVKRSATKLLTDAPHDVLVRTWNSCLGAMANSRATCGAAAKMFESKTGKMPWDVGDLPNLPRGVEWKQRVADVFPAFKRRA